MAMNVVGTIAVLACALATEGPAVPAAGTGQYDELAGKLVAAAQRIRSYSFTVQTTRRVLPAAATPEEVAKAVAGFKVVEGTASAEPGTTPEPPREVTTEEDRQAYRRRLLEGSQTSTTTAVIGQRPGRFRTRSVTEDAGEPVVTVTDGATFLAWQSPDPSGVLDWVVTVQKARADLAPTMYTGYPYERWLATGTIVGASPLGRGLERIKLKLADGSGSVLIDAAPQQGYLARQVQVLDATGRVVEVSKNEDLEEFDGIWVPQRVTRQEYKMVDGRPVLETESVDVMKDVKLNLPMTGAEFELKPPPKCRVIDMREVPPVTYFTNLDGMPAPEAEVNMHARPPG
jgi:hypothetical protein